MSREPPDAGQAGFTLVETLVCLALAGLIGCCCSTPCGSPAGPRPPQPARRGRRRYSRSATTSGAPWAAWPRTAPTGAGPPCAGPRTGSSRCSPPTRPWNARPRSP
ncbi:prepilin-type N-terminal cleavage/methylation domain-containing protein [Methylobacterium aquaticum]|nr:prepilin-type N-terminal cleavage/methylation domain-containing protein [Methylobacterium aquaticum]